MAIGCHALLLSEQVGMGTGTVENDLAACLINAVNKHPIRFNMTSPSSLILSVQRVIFVLW